MAGLIEDYALIGDMQTAALVGKDGSIDWLCLPRFDSEACFAALLGDERYGYWQIAPARDFTRIRRRYRPGTLVLETEFSTASGVVRLVANSDKHGPSVRTLPANHGLLTCRGELDRASPVTIVRQ